MWRDAKGSATSFKAIISLARIIISVCLRADASFGPEGARRTRSQIYGNAHKGCAFSCIDILLYEKPVLSCHSFLRVLYLILYNPLSRQDTVFTLRTSRHEIRLAV